MLFVRHYFKNFMHITLTTATGNKFHHYPCLKDEETEGQTGEVTLPEDMSSKWKR